MQIIGLKVFKQDFPKIKIFEEDFLPFLRRNKNEKRGYFEKKICINLKIYQH